MLSLSSFSRFKVIELSLYALAVLSILLVVWLAAHGIYALFMASLASAILGWGMVVLIGICLGYLLNQLVSPLQDKRLSSQTNWQIEPTELPKPLVSDDLILSDPTTIDQLVSPLEDKRLSSQTNWQIEPPELPKPFVSDDPILSDPPIEKKAESNIPKPVIVVQCMNNSDGMGDIGHLFNIGQALAAHYPQYQIVYRVYFAYNKEVVTRLRCLADKLLYLKLIPEIPKEFDGENLNDEVLEQALQVATSNRFYLLKGEDPCEEANLYIDVSWPIDLIITRLKHNPGSPRLFFGEHGDDYKIAKMEAKSIPLENLHLIGIGEFKYRDQYSRNRGDRQSIGLPLEDHLRKTPGSQAALLADITHAHFHNFLHGKDRIDKKAAQSVVEKTAFIPCYFLRDKDEALAMVVASAANAFEKDDKIQTVFLKGNFESKALFTQKNIDLLKMKGFTTIEYYNPKRQEKRQQTISKKRPAKVLKLLSDAYFSEADHARMIQLGSALMGCSGDNSLQEAISNGALPLFNPHSPIKVQPLVGLLRILRAHSNASKWQLCIQFLESYQRYHHVDQNRKEMFQNISKCITPALIAQWREVCAYVIKHHNAYPAIFREVDRVLGPVPVSSAAPPLSP